METTNTTIDRLGDFVGKTVTLKAEKLTARALADAVAKQLGLTWKRDDSAVRFGLKR